MRKFGWRCKVCFDNFILKHYTAKQWQKFGSYVTHESWMRFYLKKIKEATLKIKASGENKKFFFISFEFQKKMCSTTDWDIYMVRATHFYFLRKLGTVKLRIFKYIKYIWLAIINDPKLKSLTENKKHRETRIHKYYRNNDLNR